MVVRTVTGMTDGDDNQYSSEISVILLQVDVMVNSTGKNLALDNGDVSKAILSSAGPDIQKECRQKTPKGLSQFGDIFATKAYNLSCTAVYHGAALPWDGENGHAEKVSAPLHYFRINNNNNSNNNLNDNGWDVEQ